MVSLDSVKVYANLDGIWTDISADVEVMPGIKIRWGIFGYSPVDILADTGDLRFTLKNPTGKYYPDGASPLSGWGEGTRIKIVFSYNSFPYVRFVGRIPKDGIRLRPGKVTNQDLVDVTVLDWMKHAIETPIVSPSIEEDKTADEAITILLDSVPYTIGTDLDTGDYTFPAVFDGTNQSTTAYSEFSRLVYSESPGRIYVSRQGEDGELLIFENSTHRDSPTQKTTFVQAPRFWLNSTGGHWLNSTGGKWRMASAQQSSETAVTISTDIDNVDLEYGSNVVNHVVLNAYPKRTDEDLQVLYRLPYSVPIANTETKYITGRYVDPSGGGTRINAIVASMQDPDPPGGADPTLMVLLTYSDATFVDDTGRHTVTQNDVERWNTFYDNGFYTVLTSGVLGPYAVYGGYANYELTMPSSTDFDLFNGTPCTVGFFAAIINPASGNNILTRSQSSSFPPYLLGVPNGEGANVRINMSSNGSSWDVANSKSWGRVVTNKWVYYELNYEDGWFYAFADGKQTDKWYSATYLPASNGTFSIGRTQGSSYGWFAHDMFFIRKGIALHKAEFEPPRREIEPTLEGDYLMNTAADGTGTDLSDDLAISAVYDPDEVTYTLTNNSGSDGFITFLQARGRGLYNYDKISKTVEDAASITANGYQNLNINQYYQQDLDAGTTWITAIIAAEKDARTVLRGVSFVANHTALTMQRFLQCDVGDLVEITLSSAGIDGFYHIQNVGIDVRPGNVVTVTWGVVEGNTPA